MAVSWWDELMSTQCRLGTLLWQADGGSAKSDPPFPAS
jgi:hypothetical protein